MLTDSILQFGVLTFSAIVGYVAMFTMLQVGKLRTELLLELRDLEARILAKINAADR